MAKRNDLELCGTAQNAFDAVELSGLLQPDLVLLNLDIPQMHGIDAAEAIKRRFPNISVILLTTYNSNIARALSTASGIDAIFCKTDGFCALLDAIENTIAKRNSHRNNQLV
jgi:DNA-binding NarL/FixJ family response regulator